MAFGLIEQILIALYLVATLGYFAYAMFVRLRITLAAEPDGRAQGLGAALSQFVSQVIFQTKVIADRPISGLLHAFVFWGFICYIPATIHHFLLPFTGGYLHGPLADGYKLFMAVASAVVALSIAALAFRRFVMRPKYFAKKLSGASAVVALFIFTLMVTYILEPHLDGLAARANWWIHASAVLLFLVVIPHSKHLHLVLGAFNILYMRDGFGRLPALNIEELTEESALGVGTPADAARKSRLDAFSCVECGRCTEWCPANRLDKALDPRSLVHDLEKPLLSRAADLLFDGTVSSEAVWQCLTCGSCEQICPLGVQHLPLILQYRRHLTLERTEIPETMVATFRSLQNKGNVWLTDRERRAELIEEMGLPAFEPGKILVWSSCFFLTAEFAPTVKQFVELLGKAGLDVGISPDEICCGDPARKCGGEDTFQELAAQNLEWMKAQGVKTVVSDCPHCLQTLAEGYTQLDPQFRVETVHHSVLLAELLAEGKLRSAAFTDGAATIHDPCYASRWGYGDVEAIRCLAAGSGVEVAEMPLSRRRSYCCGSGGGAHHFFEDDDRIRIDDERIRQILATGANTVVTACPFCHNMISEGAKRDDTRLNVVDISHLLET